MEEAEAIGMETGLHSAWSEYIRLLFAGSSALILKVDPGMWEDNCFCSKFCLERDTDAGKG